MVKSFLPDSMFPTTNHFSYYGNSNDSNNHEENHPYGVTTDKPVLQDYNQTDSWQQTSYIRPPSNVESWNHQLRLREHSTEYPIINEQCSYGGPHPSSYSGVLDYSTDNSIVERKIRPNSFGLANCDDESSNSPSNVNSKLFWDVSSYGAACSELEQRKRNPSNFSEVKISKNKEKYRVVYTEHQRTELEKEFQASKYITIDRKLEISSQLSLTSRQVKIWFQNRRAKERRVMKKRIEEIKRATDRFTNEGNNNTVQGPFISPIQSNGNNQEGLDHHIYNVEMPTYMPVIQFEDISTIVTSSVNEVNYQTVKKELENS